MKWVFKVLRWIFLCLFSATGILSFLSYLGVLFYAFFRKNSFRISLPPFYLLPVSFFLEWIAGIYLSLTYPLGFFPFPPLFSSSSSSLPVLVFVHGYSMTWGSWFYYLLRFYWKGYRRLYAVTLPPFASIEVSARILHEHLKKMVQKDKTIRFILVGHSMGGLVIRSYLQQFPQNRVIHGITIGTPHSGTVTAYLGFGKNAREMEPGSSFLFDLLPLPSTFVTIASRMDNLVLPWDSSYLPSRPSYLFHSLSHNFLLLSPRVFQILYEEVEKSSSYEPS